MIAKLETQQSTPDGEPRGYIDPHALRELWFHTGTACNLACPFCLEGSKPGDGRLDRIRLSDAKPLIGGEEQIGRPDVAVDEAAVAHHRVENEERLGTVVLTIGGAP